MKSSIAALLDAKGTTLIGPIPKENRQAIIAYIENPAPTPESWRDIRGMIIDGSSLRRGTIWQALIHLTNDKEAGCQQNGPPDPFTVARAIRQALR